MAVMHHSCPGALRARGVRSTRLFAAPAAIVAAVGLTSGASAAAWHWAAATGQWSSSNNWAQFSPPPDGSQIFLGTLPAAANGISTNNLGGTRTYASLVVTNGMTLHNTSVTHTIILGDTVVTGGNVLPSRLWLEGVKGTTLTTQNLTLQDGAVADLDGAFVRVNERFTVDAESTVTGQGVIDFWDSGATLINNGVIRAGGGNPLHFRQFGGGLYDLDGTSGDGRLDLSTHADARMRFQGAGLSDSYSGRITMRGGSHLDMDLTNGWVADANSVIDVTTNLSGPAYIEGDGAVTLAGQVNVHGTGWLNVTSASVTIAPTFDLNVETNNAFTVQAPTVVEGGTFTIAPSGTLRFDGTTTLRGGLFDAQDGYTVTGGTTFFGDVILDGVVNVSGTVRTLGDVSTAGTSTINADYLLMSPQEFNAPTWTITHWTTVNAEGIASPDGMGAITDNTFVGDMHIGGVSGRFTLNLENPDAAWTMAGSLELGGFAGFYTTRVVGSAMIVTGEVLVEHGLAQVDSAVEFRDGSALVIESEHAALRLRGGARIAAGAEFHGDGTLRNGANATMTLDDGVDLDGIGLENDGTLRIGDGPTGAPGVGVAAVDRFASAEGAAWAVDVIGLGSSVAHDLLLVTGGDAALAGELLVDVSGTTTRDWLPQEGDEFTILTALGGVSGVFSNDPVSTYAGGITLEWEVLYGEHDVTLRLARVVPAPGGAGVMMLLGVAAAARRRRRAGYAESSIP